MLTDGRCADSRVASLAALERRRQKRLAEAAENFDVCRSLSWHMGQAGVPRYERHYARWSRYWWKQFGFALADELDRMLYLDEVDAALFTMVGSGP